MPVMLRFAKQRQEDQEFKTKPGLHSKLEANLGCVRLCFKNKNKIKNYSVYLNMQIMKPFYICQSYPDLRMRFEITG